MKSLAKFECMEMRIHYFPTGGFKQENNKIKTDPKQIIELYKLSKLNV